MENDSGYAVIITTCADREQAEKLASALVSSRLAACVQLSDTTSFYTWKGSVEKENEVRLMIKARKVLYPEIETFIIENHPYELPEVIMLPIADGLAGYLDWIDASSR